MKIYVLDWGLAGADVFVTDTIEEAVKYFQINICKWVKKEHLKEYEIEKGLFFLTRGED